MATWTAGTALGTGVLITQAWVQNVVNAQKFLAANDATYGKDLAYMRRTTTQSLTAGVWTAISFDTEDIDVANGHSTSTNTSRYTAQATGKYRITGAASFTWSTINADLGIAFRKNGSGTGLTGQINGSYNLLYSQTPSVGYIVAPTAYVALTAGDYVEMVVYCNGTTPSANQNNTQMGIEWVGA